MSQRPIHQCQCEICQPADPSHECFAESAHSATLVRSVGSRSPGMAALNGWRSSGMNVNTIRRGRRELDDDLAGRPTDRVRKPGGGRPPLEKKVQL